MKNVLMMTQMLVFLKDMGNHTDILKFLKNLDGNKEFLNL